MEIMYTNPMGDSLPKVRARIGGITELYFEEKSNEPRPPSTPRPQPPPRRR